MVKIFGNSTCFVRFNDCSPHGLVYLGNLIHDLQGGLRKAHGSGARRLPETPGNNGVSVWDSRYEPVTTYLGPSQHIVSVDLGHCRGTQRCSGNPPRPSSLDLSLLSLGLEKHWVSPALTRKARFGVSAIRYLNQPVIRKEYSPSM